MVLGGYVGAGVYICVFAQVCVCGRAFGGVVSMRAQACFLCLAPTTLESLPSEMSALYGIGYIAKNLSVADVLS